MGRIGSHTCRSADNIVVGVFFGILQVVFMSRCIDNIRMSFKGFKQGLLKQFIMGMGKVLGGAQKFPVTGIKETGQGNPQSLVCLKQGKQKAGSREMPPMVSYTV